MLTPYSPPARRPSRHASIECAQPSRCSRPYAWEKAGVIHPSGRSLRPHSATTSSKAVSMRISKSRADLRSERDTRSPSSGSTPRSTGENHPSSSLSDATGIGKRPAP